MNKVEEALQKLFSKYRIIIWYDEKQDMTDQFNEIELAGINKWVVDNNQFFIKNLVVMQKPQDKFLLYLPYARPEHANNWLLDQELAHYVFQTNQEAMYAQELELEYHFTDLIGEHVEFFKNKERRAKLKELLGKDDDFQAVRYKMLAVVFSTENISLVSYLLCHASSFNDGNDRFDRDLERYNLAKFYWAEISRKYGYTSEIPSVYDFLIEVFSNNFSLGRKTNISKETKILVSVWKDTISHQDAFREISTKIAEDLKIELRLNEAKLDELLDDDLFELIDKRIISTLVQQIVEDAISPDRLIQIIKRRENKYWYSDYASFYACLENSILMISMVKKYQKIKIGSFSDGITSYVKDLYKIDLHYRKYINHYKESKQNRVLQPLTEKVEKVYGNDWLFEFGNEWQKSIDVSIPWYQSGITSQRRFFEDHVKPFISKGQGQRLFVIITDALRYECGWEYWQKIQNEKRFEGEMEFLVSSLPSYTQLGMASLLPNKAIALQEGSEYVQVDGISTQGTQNRTKVLEQLSGVRAVAISAEDLMKMNAATDGREFVKQYDLIYVFHNQIDKIGDDKVTEGNVFEAVESELDYLMDLVKKIANMNGNNMFITSDHGFLYQNNELLESDFSTGDVSGDIWKSSRRYIIGKNLVGDQSTTHYTSHDLNLMGDAEVLIPKTINRFRIKGAGSRYVHGGASLQEIVIPLVKVSKTRQDTTKLVDIDIIKSTDKITTNILAVSFLQTELVTDKILPRQIRSAIFTEDGTQISDLYTYNFDITSGTERMREVKHRFQLSSKASGQYKNQRVKLVLEEPVEGTSKWTKYKEFSYSLNISFTNDFDEN